jgi:hypothetical protein
MRVRFRAFARRTSSRWSRSGTFRTWILFDMRTACHVFTRAPFGASRT